MSKEHPSTQSMSTLSLSFPCLLSNFRVYPVNPGDHSPAQLRKTFKISLTALGREKSRVLYLHAPDRATPFEDTLQEIDKLYKEGLL